MDSESAAVLVARFVRWDLWGAIGGIAFVVVANGLFVQVAGVWLVVPFLLVLVGALVLAGRLVRERLVAALGLVMAGNGVVAIAVSGLFPFLWPVMIVVVLVPLVLATPFLHAGQLRLAIGGTALAVGAVAAVGLAEDDGGVVEDVDDTFELVLVIAALAALTLPLTVVVQQNNALQRRSFDDLSAAQQELVRSRRRVVDAADAARQQIERTLHDGAQQRLLALGMRLRLLESQVDEPHRAMVTGVLGEFDATVEELRELSHGIYPPVLAAKGLSDALRSVARRSPMDIDVRVDDVGRLSPSVESALYYTALEALSNATKHAPGERITLSLSRSPDSPGSSGSRSDGGLVMLRVEDGGPGFDPEGVELSHGLIGMADRVGALDGELTVESRPGEGTSVSAVVPVS